MLKRKNRLPSQVKLTRAKTTHSPFFILKAALNDLEYNRATIIVGKKIDKRAVTRNKIKRRIRACLESLILAMKPGKDILILTKPSIKDTTQQMICKELTKLLLS